MFCKILNKLQRATQKSSIATSILLLLLSNLNVTRATSETQTYLNAEIEEDLSYIQSEPTGLPNYLTLGCVNESVDSGLVGIDRIFMINLEIRPENLVTCKAAFAEFGLGINRFEAINGWTLDYNEKDLFGDPTPSYSDEQKKYLFDGKSTIRRGTLGCLLSHLSIIQDAYNQGLDRVWIVEDDSRIVENPRQVPAILDALTILDPDWDVYYTDPHGVTPHIYNELYVRPERRLTLPHTLIPSQHLTDDIMTAGLRHGNHSYIMSRKGMKKTLDYFTHTYIYIAFDVERHFIPHIREYACPRPIVTAIHSSWKSDTWYEPKIGDNNLSSSLSSSDELSSLETPDQEIDLVSSNGSSPE